MKAIFFLLLSLFTLSSYAQKIRPQINNIVEIIIKENQLESERVGAAGSLSSAYQAFIELRNMASLEELKTLLHHNNSVVKGYASWALADKQYFKIKDVFISFFDSDEEVTTQQGCIVSSEKLFVELYYRMYYQKNYNDQFDQLLWQTQLKQLDSVILYNPIKDKYVFSRSLGNNNANSRTYERIKYIAIQENNNQALVELAKYKKQKDIPVFIALGVKSFEAIAYFPDKEFWNFLIQYLDKESAESFYQAIASFKDLHSRQAIEKIYERLSASSDVGAIKQLQVAIYKQYDTLYSGVALKMWRDYKLMNWRLLNKLNFDGSTMLKKTLIEGFLKSSRLSIYDLEYDFLKDSTLSYMLKIIKDTSVSVLTEICKTHIQSANFTTIALFSEFAEQQRLSGVGDAGLQKIKLLKSMDAYGIYHLSKMILSFKDQSITSALLEVLRERKKDWYWDNWQETFEELFSKYKVTI